MLICTLINAEYHCARLCLQKRLFSALHRLASGRALVDQDARALPVFHLEGLRPFLYGEVGSTEFPP